MTYPPMGILFGDGIITIGFVEDGELTNDSELRDVLVGALLSVPEWEGLTEALEAGAAAIGGGNADLLRNLAATLQLPGWAS